MSRLHAILIVGPTGSGKTPLGEELESRGLRGKRCFHFDFGEQLRAVVAGSPESGISETEAEFIRGLLERGALLENETFFLAEKILDGFLTNESVQPDDLLVLNGLPRHVGQAMSIDSHLNILAVVHLDCSAETVLKRIETNAGGDRSERSDDNLELIQNKISTFHERTVPLLAHYRQYGSQVLDIEVTEETSPSRILARLDALHVL